MAIVSIKDFKPEELVFAAIAVSSVVLETSSVVPALVSCCLLSFYYLVFGWYMLSVKAEKKLFRAVLFGVFYAVLWLSTAACAVKMFGEFGGFLFAIEGVILFFMGLYLFLTRHKNSRIFSLTNYCRIAVVVILNVFIILFK